MDRDTTYRMSLALLVSVAIAAGVSAPMAAGLGAGMERVEALALMGDKPDPEHLHDGVYSFSGCPEWRDGELIWDSGNDYFEFAFGDDGRIAFIRLIADRP